MGKNIIHLEFLEAPQNGRRHHYFGSKAAMYRVFTSDDIGITYGALRNFRELATRPYVNDKCVIRQGELLVSSNKK